MRLVRLRIHRQLEADAVIFIFFLRRFEIEIGGLRFAARGGLRAPYDPDGTRVKS